MICVDELGPLAVKTYPGEEWKPGKNRATFEPDYGRRGTLWVLGAFEPATGQAAILLSPRRDSPSYIQLLEKMETDAASTDAGVTPQTGAAGTAAAATAQPNGQTKTNVLQRLSDNAKATGAETAAATPQAQNAPDNAVATQEAITGTESKTDSKSAGAAMPTTESQAVKKED